MPKYQLELSPTNIPNNGGEGSLDTSLLNGNSIQRTGYVTLINEDGSTKTLNLKDGDTFDSTTQGFVNIPSVIIQVGYLAVFTQDLYGNTETGLVSGNTVLDVGSNAQLLALLNPSTEYGNDQFLLYNDITITYSDNTTQTFSDCRCTNINGSVLSFGYGATTAGHNFPITLQTFP